MRKVTATAVGFNAVYVVSQAIIARRLGPVAHDALRLQTTTSAAKFRWMSCRRCRPGCGGGW